MFFSREAIDTQIQQIKHRNAETTWDSYFTKIKFKLPILRIPQPYWDGEVNKIEIEIGDWAYSGVLESYQCIFWKLKCSFQRNMKIFQWSLQQDLESFNGDGASERLLLSGSFKMWKWICALEYMTSWICLPLIY